MGIFSYVTCRSVRVPRKSACEDDVDASSRQCVFCTNFLRSEARLVLRVGQTARELGQAVAGLKGEVVVG